MAHAMWQGQQIMMSSTLNYARYGKWLQNMPKSTSGRIINMYGSTKTCRTERHALSGTYRGKPLHNLSLELLFILRKNTITKFLILTETLINTLYEPVMFKVSGYVAKYSRSMIKLRLTVFREAITMRRL